MLLKYQTARSGGRNLDNIVIAVIRMSRVELYVLNINRNRLFLLALAYFYAVILRLIHYAQLIIVYQSLKRHLLVRLCIFRRSVKVYRRGKAVLIRKLRSKLGNTVGYRRYLKISFVYR